MSRYMKLSYEDADKLAPSSIPMGRIAEVEEVANLMVVLASPLMRMVNGTQIEIDSGQEKPLMDRARDRTWLPSINLAVHLPCGRGSRTRCGAENGTEPRGVMPSWAPLALTRFLGARQSNQRCTLMDGDAHDH
jgi:hypothetical protein